MTDDERNAKLKALRDEARAIEREARDYGHALVVRLIDVLTPPEPPTRWGIWVQEYERDGSPGWLQGAGIPGPRYAQGTEEEMRAECHGRPRCEPRPLPPGLAAKRYEGGP